MKIRPFVSLAICYLFVYLISSCGYKADPSPLFPTAPTAIDQEIQHRKDESKKNADPPKAEEKQP